MNTFKKLEQMWEQDRRYATRYILVFSGSVFIHAVLAVMFGLAGRYGFVAANVASMALYLGWLWVFARKPVNDGMLLALYLDVLIHASVYNVYLGQGSGFFVYPFIMIPVTFFLAARDLKHSHTVANSAVLSIASVVIMLITLKNPPLAPMERALTETQFFQVNVLMCALLLSMYTSEFMSETMSTQDNLSFQAEFDQLTGLRNRHGFLKEVERLHGSQYCVVMCDIDDFKQVNDLYGHSSGDALLNKIGKLLNSCIRKEDIACRWGGEEFVMIIRSDPEAAAAAVERIRRKLATVAVEASDTSVSVTMTFGIADCLEAETFEQQVEIADSNLIRGKRSGKNCVVLTSSVRENDTVIPENVELDTSFLKSRTFSAFSATSDSTYVYMCNLNTNVSRWSRTAVDYFGLPGEYMYDAANIWLGFVHPDDRLAYSQDLESVLAGRKRFHDVTYRARNKDGEYVRLSCKGVVTGGDATSPAIFAGTITNLGLTDLNGNLR